MNGNRVEHFLAELACGEDSRAERAAGEIAALPLDEQLLFLPLLHAMLGSPEADRRWWAARALAEIPDPRIPGWLAEMLSDPDASVRQCAALGLRQQPDAQAVPWLVEALCDADDLVARLAGDALSTIGEPAVLPLVELLHGSLARATFPPHARREAVRALAVIGDPRAVSALYEILEDDSALLVYWAEQGLERMGVGMVYFKP